MNGLVQAKAQMVRMPLTSVYLQANSYSSLQADAFSFSSNQASLAQVKNFSAGLYSERRFMLSELSQYKAAVALPTSSGNFGMNAGYFGSQLYNESQLGLAYARSLGKVNVGVQFNYYQLKAQGYGSGGSINFEGGAVFKINEKLNTGLHVYNPLGSRIGKNEEEKLPTVYSAGFGYDASDKFFFGGQFEKTEDQPISFNAGIQYCFAEKLITRTGISSGITSFYFGVGFLYNDFRLDATTSLHQQLGFSPGLMLIYTNAKK